MRNVNSFADLPVCRNLSALSADIAIIGIPHGTSYRQGEPSHSSNAPEAIRRAARRYGDMIDHYDFDLDGPLLNNSGVRVVDCGDLPGNPSDPAGNRRVITETARAILDAEAVPIVLGGDDSIPISFFRAYKGLGLFTVVQVDAHIDWRHEINGITQGPSSTMRRVSEMAWIDRLIQVGMRGVGSARMEEVAAAKAYGAEIITAKEVHDGGVDQVLALVPDGAACLLTIDCDGLDPSIMPGVNAPVPGGLTYRQVIDLVHGLTKKVCLKGFDLVELMPKNDVNGIAALTAVRIIFNLIGSLVRSKYFVKRTD